MIKTAPNKPGATPKSSARTSKYVVALTDDELAAATKNQIHNLTVKFCVGWRRTGTTKEQSGVTSANGAPASKPRGDMCAI